MKHRHCEDYIEDETAPKCLRRYLEYERSNYEYRDKLRAVEGFTTPVLFATPKETITHHIDGSIWAKGEKIRVVMASRMGDVGISKNLTQEQGYSLRVYVDALENFTES